MKPRHLAAGTMLFSLLATVLLAAADDQPESKSAKIGDARYNVSATWKEEKPTSRFRVAQFEIAQAEGDAEPATLIVFHFGKGGGGGVAANLQRWKGQFDDTEKPAKVEETSVKDVKITTLDISGTFKDRPFPAAQNFTARKNYRMLTAIVETDNGPYYFRLVGPQRTVAQQEKAWKEMLQSLDTDAP